MATTCLSPFRGPILNFYNTNDLWTMTTYQQQPLFLGPKGGYCRPVWLHFVIKVCKPAHANVNFHGPLGIDGETLVGIDGNTEETWVSVDELILVPDNWVPQDTCIIEVCQAEKYVLYNYIINNSSILNIIFSLKKVAFTPSGPTESLYVYFSSKMSKIFYTFVIEILLK